MHLLIDGQAHTLTDIRDFRATYGLPDDFGVALFEPKSYAGLGSLDHAGRALHRVREAVLESIPLQIEFTQLLAFFARLAETFHAQLIGVNDAVKLRDQEIEFAVNGFDAVNQKLLYALARRQFPLPEFDVLYQEWLDESARISQRVHEYVHHGDTWRVQIINDAYGRVGLIVDTGQATHYLHDESLACPAAGFMAGLLRAVYERVIKVAVL